MFLEWAGIAQSV